MAISRWWIDKPAENLWLESTDRTDLGRSLYAPLFDESGKDNWRYSLCRDTLVGDVVYHYHKPRKAIVASSTVAGPPESRDIVWAARGTYARAKGSKPVARSGIWIPLKAFRMLPQPITLEEIRNRKQRLQAVVEDLQAQHGPLYQPFEIGGRPVRVLQGYLFKLPRAILEAISTRPASRSVHPEETPDREYLEGQVRKVLVNQYERDEAARQACIDHYGCRCCVCGFDFEQAYGALGAGIIHVHHLKQLSSIGREYKVDPIRDLRPVCPNCHAVIHSQTDHLPLEVLERALQRHTAAR